MDTASPSRRAFVAALPALVFGLAVRPHCAMGMAHAGPGSEHPDPRPGIDASRLPSRESLAQDKDVAAVFDMVREMPQIVDGIRCHCGCADRDGFRSLLTCYEGKDAMARDCHTCRGEAKLAYSLFREGKGLDDIRAAIDKKYA